MSTQTVTLRLVLEGQEARAEVRGTAEDVKKLEGAPKAQGAGAKSVAREQAAAAKAEKEGAMAGADDADDDAPEVPKKFLIIAIIYILHIHR